jgi:hypothetical protein
VFSGGARTPGNPSIIGGFTLDYQSKNMKGTPHRIAERDPFRIAMRHAWRGQNRHRGQQA